MFISDYGAKYFLLNGVYFGINIAEIRPQPVVDLRGQDINTGQLSTDRVSKGDHTTILTLRSAHKGTLASPLLLWSHAKLMLCPAPALYWFSFFSFFEKVGFILIHDIQANT